MKNLLAAWQLNKQMVILIMLIFAAVVYVDFSFVISTQSRSLQGIDAKIKQTVSSIASLNRDLVVMKTKKKEQAQQFAKAPVKKIISDSEFVLLLNDISKKANKFNMKIVQLKPGQISPKDIDKNRGKPQTMAISMDLIGNYHSLGAFINSLENSKEFIAVSGIKIGHQDSNYLVENISLDLYTYVYR